MCISSIVLLSYILIKDHAFYIKGNIHSVPTITYLKLTILY